ncbi:hypothetical protein, partial [Streptomyces hygroscopicus]|uniref:hypothetical protein n=1 Tax=Streptomyces hygroscopicus TaxID=1912 RepID=UPI00367D01D3
MPSSDPYGYPLTCGDTQVRRGARAQVRRGARAQVRRGARGAASGGLNEATSEIIRPARRE